MAPVKEHWLLQHVEKLEQALAAGVAESEREGTGPVSHALAGVEKALRERTEIPQARKELSATLQELTPETPSTTARQVSKLRQEQLELLEQIAALRMQVQNTVVIPEFAAIRQKAEPLLATLRQHRETEIKLVLETANRDVGAGD